MARIRSFWMQRSLCSEDDFHNQRCLKSWKQFDSAPRWSFCPSFCETNATTQEFCLINLDWCMFKLRKQLVAKLLVHLQICIVAKHLFLNSVTTAYLQFLYYYPHIPRQPWFVHLDHGFTVKVVKQMKQLLCSFIKLVVLQLVFITSVTIAFLQQCYQYPPVGQQSMSLQKVQHKLAVHLKLCMQLSFFWPIWSHLLAIETNKGAIAQASWNWSCATTVLALLKKAGNLRRGR